MIVNVKDGGTGTPETPNCCMKPHPSLWRVEVSLKIPIWKGFFLGFIIYHDLSWVKNGLTMISTMMNGIVYWMLGYFMGYSLVIEQMEDCHFLWRIQFDE